MLANAITLSRIILAAAFAATTAIFPFCGYRTETGVSWLPFAILTTLAAGIELTDALDGPIARKLGSASTLGGILDPLADSLSRLTVYSAMALAGWVTIAVPLVMAGRDIVAAYARVAQALSGGKTAARLSGKLKAIIQGAGVFAILVAASPAFAGESESRTIVTWSTTAAVIAVTLWSLLDYMRAAGKSFLSLRQS